MQWPADAGSFNHRAEAFYTKEADGGNPIIDLIREQGLMGVSILHWDIPDRIWAKLITLLNQYHKGSGVSIMDLLKDAIDLESEWKADCRKTHVNLNNPRYKDLKKEFIQSKSASQDHHDYFKFHERYNETLSVAHTLKRCKIEEDYFQWLNSNMNFLKEIEPMAIIAVLHQLLLIIQGNMRRYWPQELQNIIMLEAFKFCVSSPDGL